MGDYERIVGDYERIVGDYERVMVDCVKMINTLKIDNTLR